MLNIAYEIAGSEHEARRNIEHRLRFHIVQVHEVNRLIISQDGAFDMEDFIYLYVGVEVE